MPQEKCMIGRMATNDAADPRSFPSSRAARATTTAAYTAAIWRRRGLSIPRTSAGATSCRTRISRGWRREVNARERPYR